MSKKKKEFPELHIDLTRPEVVAWVTGESEDIPPDIVGFLGDLAALEPRPDGPTPS